MPILKECSIGPVDSTYNPNVCQTERMQLWEEKIGSEVYIYIYIYVIITVIKFLVEF